MKGELDGGISSAAGGPVQVVRDRPDVMSREGAERQARTAGLCEECRMREAHYGFRTGWRAERRTTLGEFNWSSQHLDDEVLRCRDGNGEGQTGRVGLRCVRLVGRRQRGVRSSNGSGRRSRGGCRVRMPLCPVACRRPWVVGGSVRAVVCRRSAWRPDRLATCPLRSGKRSRSCALRAPGCVTLPVGSGEPRRLSRESYVATRRLGAAVWRIGRRLRSGTAPDVPRARRSPSWPRTIG